MVQALFYSLAIRLGSSVNQTVQVENPRTERTKEDELPNSVLDGTLVLGERVEGRGGILHLRSEDGADVFSIMGK